MAACVGASKGVPITAKIRTGFTEDTKNGLEVAKLLQELPDNKKNLSSDAKFLTHRAKALMKDLATINNEIAQMVVSADEGKVLPEWFMVEIIRDLPRLVQN